MKIAVAGAGIYGSTIAIELAKSGHDVEIYDPLGVMNAASSINQYRVHKGYHYPRSSETISEILEARDGFLSEYKSSIINSAKHYYAIPKYGSLTTTEDFELVCNKHKLELKEAVPNWMDFNFIDRCYVVDEALFDHVALRKDILRKFKRHNVTFYQYRYDAELMDTMYEKVVMATYGQSGSHTVLFNKVQVQVAEKVLIDLPEELKGISLVIVDGPFTAFDPYRNTGLSIFGSAKYTNHWKSFDLEEKIPSKYMGHMNAKEFSVFNETNFQLMKDESSLAVPLSSKAKYVGSRLTKRYVEYNPSEDRRVLHVCSVGDKYVHVFSGKVVSAVKASSMVREIIEKR